MSHKSMLILSLLLCTNGILYGRSVDDTHIYWSISKMMDHTILAGKFYKDPQSSSKGLLGKWKNEPICTADYPTSYCDPSITIEFLPDSTFTYLFIPWNPAPIDQYLLLDSLSVNSNIIDSTMPKQPDYKLGTYKQINDSTVALKADWCLPLDQNPFSARSSLDITVKDENTKQPISNCTIQLSYNKKNCLAYQRQSSFKNPQSPNFVISNIAFGVYDILIKHEGYAPLEIKSLKFKPKKPKKLKVYLEPLKSE